VNRLQRRNQRLIRNTLKKTRLITSISVADGYSIEMESAEWEDYWDGCYSLAGELQRLKASWTLLIDSGYSIERQSNYVKAYFELLHVGLNRFCRGEINLNSLRKIVAFETFQVSAEHGPLSAEIFNVRNPVYMLSRLAHPHAPDNPKYLPLVCPLDHTSETSHLYGHYRRIPICGTEGIQLFVYPSTKNRDQPLSHSLIGRLFASLTPKTDPWVHERSRFLFNGVFAALVAQFESRRIQLLDIACGPAKTTMSLCKKAFDAYRKSFDLTLVDVVRGRKTIATTFFRNPSTFGNIIFRRESLFDWVDKNHSAASVHFDIVLMLRICDVFSRFHIETIPFREASMLLRREGSFRPFEADVLHPEKMIKDNRLDSIDHSIKRLKIQNGTAFRQFSLSDYFKAIYAVIGGEITGENNMLYLPIRRFDGNALVLPSGQSLIGQLMTMADRIVVEDADLSPHRLQRHFDRFALHDLRITDMTSLTKMRGASICIIDQKT